MNSFYFANWTTGKKRAPVYATGHIMAVTRAIPLSRSVDAALVACAGWPVDVYEVKVDSVSQDAADESPVFATSFRILRLVSAEEVFGPRARELVALLEKLPGTPWLAPPRPPEEASLQQLVDTYYRSLAAYSPLDPAPLCLVQTWQHANALRLDLSSQRPTAYLSSLRSVREASCGTKKRAVVRSVMESAALHIAFLPVWEAAWRYSSAAYINDAAQRGGDSILARQQAEAVCAEFIATCEASSESPWQTMKRVGGGPERNFNEPACPPDAAHRAEAVRRLVTSVYYDIVPAWVEAFNFVQEALAEAAAVARFLIEPSDHPTPSIALLEMYQDGVWPIGEHEGKFLVFAPPSAAT